MMMISQNMRGKRKKQLKKQAFKHISQTHSSNKEQETLLDFPLHHILYPMYVSHYFLTLPVLMYSMLHRSAMQNNDKQM